MTADETEETVVARLVERLGRAGFVRAAEVGSGVVNHVIECRAPDFAVRLTGDRGQWWAEGGLPGGSSWFDAAVWSSCLTGAPPPEPLPLEEEVDYFIEHHESLADAAREEATWACLKTNRERRARERLGTPRQKDELRVVESRDPSADQQAPVRPWPGWVRYTLLALLFAVIGIGLVVALYDKGVLPIAGPFVVIALLPLLAPLQRRGQRRREARRAHRDGRAGEES